jgi:GxxExxY protein
MDNNHKHSDITSIIIGCFFKVYNKLGFGFLEKVYQNAMLLELKKAKLHCEANKPIDVIYEDCKVGYYFADIVVNSCVIIENKAAVSLCEEHEAQLVNYLKATNIEVGILLNFGKNAEFKRKVFSNTRTLNKS